MFACMKKRIPVSIFYFLFLWSLLSAQSVGLVYSDGFETKEITADDTLTLAQYKYLHHLYDSIITTSTEDILNGSEYELYYPVYGSSPLIPKRRYPNGSIVVEGIKHSPVVLQYDTYKDLLVHFDPRHQINQSVIPVVLNKYIVDEFEVGIPDNRMKFRYLRFPDSLKNIVVNGFYEMVYEGNTSYLIRRKSLLAITGGDYIFKSRSVKFVVNKNNIYKITGRRSLLKALGDQKIRMKKFIRSNKINIRHAGKTDMRRILTYYDDAASQ